MIANNRDILLEKGELLPLMEQFYSLQGEGYNVGKPAYFIRIGGCDVGCKWCDVKESWNPLLHPLTQTNDIIKSIIEHDNIDNVVVTGGEPLKYNMDYLCKEIHSLNIKTFLETSGTQKISGQWDWICLSPKMRVHPLKIFYELANELKIIIQDENDFQWAELNAKKVNKNAYLYLQPEWSNYNKIINPIIEYIKTNPKWILSLQIHKFLKIP